MEYRRFNDTLLVRIDRGEEIIESVRKVAERENVRLASVEALGATDDFTVGVYDAAAKRYDSKTFTGPHEIVSLTGTITEKDGAFYQHLHLSAGNGDCEVFGGHLNRAVVSVTCEMVIRVLDGAVDRSPDPETGVNLLRFPD
ncbi:MAG: DNA-binding protein [Clostridia bacterium]|nr:DNA-binding protein [Clostridia bacterium]